MLSVTFEVRHRLTRPKGPGVYVPWLAEKGFIWKHKEDMEVKGENLDAVVAQVKATADAMVTAYVGDDLEAVRLEGNTDVGGVNVRLNLLVEKELPRPTKVADDISGWPGPFPVRSRPTENRPQTGGKQGGKQP